METTMKGASKKENKRKPISLSLVVVVLLIFVISGLGGESLAEELWKTLPQPLPTPKAVKSGYAKVNGVEIYYAVYGSGKPLILLHGGLGNTDYWGSQIGPFSPSTRLSPLPAEATAAAPGMPSLTAIT